MFWVIVVEVLIQVETDCVELLHTVVVLAVGVTVTVTTETELV